MQASLQTGKRPTLAILILAALLSGTSAFGQQIRFYPIRTAPLGSPAGTVTGLWPCESRSGLDLYQESPVRHKA